MRTYFEKGTGRYLGNDPSDGYKGAPARHPFKDADAVDGIFDATHWRDPVDVKVKAGSPFFAASKPPHEKLVDKLVEKGALAPGDKAGVM